MKAISLWEPWASAIAWGLKSIETRGWYTRHRGLIAIHAAKTTEHSAYVLRPEVFEAFRKVGIKGPEYLAFGCVVATANLVDCKPTEVIRRRWAMDDLPLEWHLGNYADGRFGWILEDVVPLPKPIPARGAQGFWEWDFAGAVRDDAKLQQQLGLL